MNVFLSVDLTSYDESSEETQETYAEVVKELDLEFAPFVGLELQFSPIMSDNSDVRKYQDLLALAPETITGIFKLENVYYHLEDHKFIVQARDSYKTVAMLHSAIEQLTIGYGFTRS